MKILVLGKDGMLGHVVYNYFQEQGNEVYGTTREDEKFSYDAYNNQEGIENIIEQIKPEVVINCIGILNQVAEDNHHLAIMLNTALPHYMDKLSEKYDFKFIHVSTDCVFDGEKGKYDENANPDATTFYGRSKALGEVHNDRNLTLRTSIVGPDANPKGVGLFQWFMNQKEQAGGYTKVIWTGITTIQFAKVMEEGIKNNVSGFHHVVNNDFISKHDLLILFKAAFDKEIEITENNSIISEKTLIRTDKSYPFVVPSYKKMVEDMREWVDSHEELYPNIKVKIK